MRGFLTGLFFFVLLFLLGFSLDFLVVFLVDFVVDGALRFLIGLGRCMLRKPE